MNITYIACPDESLETCSWMRFVGTSPSAAAQQGTLDELLQEAAGQKLLLVLPAVMVSLLKVQVPAKSDKQFIAALPFALEEELAEDVEQLHFAVMNRAADGQTSVAVTSRQQMQKLFDQLSQHSFSELHVIPETLLLPVNSGSWSLLVTDDHSVLRKSSAAGYGFDSDNLHSLLECESHAQAEAETEEALKVDVFDFRQQDSSQLAELPQLDSLAWQQQEMNVDDPLTARIGLFQHYWSESGDRAHNLLQGVFRIRQEVEGGRRNWLIAASLAAVSLLLLVVINGIENARLQTQLDQLESQMRTLYSEAFLGEQVSNRPVSEMRNRLAKLKRERGAADERFLDYLAVSGRHLHQLPAKSIESLRFHRQVLEIDIRASSVEAIEQLQQKMQKDTLNVELKAITSESGVVRGRLVVSEQKS
ncbi:type II secretion system protein GspL [Solemya velum gill symbiont]|uniref:type II secretion system protein GspL n=1 Tax=Solemya velum gill symbiont TaxID=2340 RepID=UPI0015C2CB70|nr:type II secretion system protein GspL [Solemya velum gill symbiont]